MCGICGVYIFDHDRVPDLETLIENIRADKSKTNLAIPDEIRGSDLKSSNAMAAGFAYALLNYLQHRGYHSSGIVSFDGSKMNVSKGMGYIRDVFTQKNLESCVGDKAIGHTRYATTGRPLEQNVQPFAERFAIGHNGNIVNERELRASISLWKYLRHAFELKSDTDSELILYAIENYWDDNLKFYENIGKVLKEFVIGSYSLAMIAENNLAGIRDPRGVWPLNIAQIGGMCILSSEEQAIRKLVELSGYKGGIDFIREVENGEIISAGDEGGWISHKGILQPMPSRRCCMDWSYLTSPDEPAVGEFRYACGKIHGKMFKSEGRKADYVTGIPQSGIIPAQGFADGSGIKYQQGAIAISPYYTGRQFLREYFAQEKFVYDEMRLKGSRVVVTEDTLIKANTMEAIIKRTRENGVEELHVRICFPPYITGCELGIHTNKDSLIARELDPEQVMPESNVEKLVEMYFLSRFFGVDYKREELIERVKKPDFSIREIVEESIKREMNFLGREKTGKIDELRFSLKYLTKEQIDEAYKAVGINPEGVCNGCISPNAKGYAEEMGKFVIGAV